MKEKVLTSSRPLKHNQEDAQDVSPRKEEEFQSAGVEQDRRSSIIELIQWNGDNSVNDIREHTNIDEEKPIPVPQTKISNSEMKEIKFDFKKASLSPGGVPLPLKINVVNVINNVPIPRGLYNLSARPNIGKTIRKTLLETDKMSIRKVDFGDMPAYNRNLLCFRLISKPKSTNTLAVVTRKEENLFATQIKEIEELQGIERKTGVHILQYVEELNNLIYQLTRTQSGLLFYWILTILAFVLLAGGIVGGVIATTQRPGFMALSLVLGVILASMLFTQARIILTKQRIIMHYAVALFTNYLNKCVFKEGGISFKPGFGGNWLEIEHSRRLETDV